MDDMKGGVKTSKYAGMREDLVQAGGGILPANYQRIGWL